MAIQLFFEVFLKPEEIKAVSVYVLSRAGTQESAASLK
jgi:hypothetical protein